MVTEALKCPDESTVACTQSEAPFRGVPLLCQSRKTGWVGSVSDPVMTTIPGIRGLGSLTVNVFAAVPVVVLDVPPLDPEPETATADQAAWTAPVPAKANIVL